MTERSTRRTAARERKRKLKVSFGEDLWNVALEPEAESLFAERIRESGSKRPRLIPVSGSEAVRVALLSDK